MWKVIFTFDHESLLLDAPLQAIRTKIFLEDGLMEVVSMCSAHITSMIVHELLECYNVVKEEQDEEDPRNMQISEIEVEHTLEGLELEYVSYAQPLKTHKVNIESK
jgi:hypothetical protein